MAPTPQSRIAAAKRSSNHRSRYNSSFTSTTLLRFATTNNASASSTSSAPQSRHTTLPAATGTTASLLGQFPVPISSTAVPETPQLSIQADAEQWQSYFNSVPLPPILHPQHHHLPAETDIHQIIPEGQATRPSEASALSTLLTNPDLPPWYRFKTHIALLSISATPAAEATAALGEQIILAEEALEECIRTYRGVERERRHCVGLRRTLGELWGRPGFGDGGEEEAKDEGKAEGSGKSEGQGVEAYTWYSGLENVSGMMGVEADEPRGYREMLALALQHEGMEAWGVSMPEVTDGNGNFERCGTGAMFVT